MKFICYPKCTTCQKAKKWLEEKGLEFEVRHIVEDNPSAEELAKWIADSGLPMKKFFNTSGLKYKELQLKDRLPEMTDEEKNAYIQEHAPFIVGDKVQVTARWTGGKPILGYVVGFRLSYNLEVEPILKKVKKDGTMSAMNLHLYGDEQIDLVEPINNL